MSVFAMVSPVSAEPSVADANGPSRISCEAVDWRRKRSVRGARRENARVWRGRADSSVDIYVGSSIEVNNLLIHRRCRDFHQKGDRLNTVVSCTNRNVVV